MNPMREGIAVKKKESQVKGRKGDAVTNIAQSIKEMGRQKEPSEEDNNKKVSHNYRKHLEQSCNQPNLVCTFTCGRDS